MRVCGEVGRLVMVSGAMLADLAVTSSINVTERERELFTRLLARDGRIEELESERDRLQEEKAGMAGRMGQLERQVEELTRKAGLNSTNSSKPPSGDGLRRKPRPSSPERERRMARLLHDVYGAEISTGTLAAMIARGGERVGPAIEELVRQLQASPVTHLDETGCHVGGDLWWAHGASTDRLTLLDIHRRRGGEGIKTLGVAGELSGIAVHDHWSSYWGDALPKVSGHALCNAHHLRELTDIRDFFGQRWANRMINLLIEMLVIRNQAMDRGQAALDPDLLVEFERRYGNIVNEGWKANPRREGRAQRSRAGNLVRRLDEHRTEVLRFLHDFRVPFTNNEIERDLDRKAHV